MRKGRPGRKDKEEPRDEDAPLIMFNGTKEEVRTVQQGLKLFSRKFRQQFKIEQNREPISPEMLTDVAVFVLPGPRKAFEPEELKTLREFMEKGGGVMIMANEGKEEQSFSHINRLTEDYGITVCHDSIVRTVYHQEYYHPKEAYIKNASLVPALDKIGRANTDTSFLYDNSGGGQERMAIAYPYGCSLEVKVPAVPLLSSGQLCFPANRAIAAYTQVKLGRLLVVGSALCFDDLHLTKADNAQLASGLMKLLSDPKWKVDNVDVDRPEYGDRLEIPDTEALAERVRACLQEGEELPVDFTQLFDHELFKYSTDVIPEAVKLYSKLNVKHEALSLIPPQFEVPLPPLQPAVFMPVMRELPPPALDLFDLDAEFSSEKLLLAQLTNKCNDDDLDYYVRESGEVLGVSDAIRLERADTQDFGDAPPEAQSILRRVSAENDTTPISAKKILEHILKKLVAYKKIEQEDDQGSMSMGGSMQRDRARGSIMNALGSSGELINNEVSEADLDSINTMGEQTGPLNL